MSFFTPFELGIILHYYCRADEFERADAPIFQSTVDRLVELDLLCRIPDGIPSLGTTARGKAFVELGLMRTRIPKQVWQMPAEDRT